MSLNDKLLDGAIKLAFEADLDCFTAGTGESDVSPALERRIKKQIASQKLHRVKLIYSRLAAACLATVMCVSAAIWYANTAYAENPIYSMVTETEWNSLYIWFVCRDDGERATAEALDFIPLTAAGALIQYNLTTLYATDSANIEEYNNGKIRFEQTALSAGGRTVIDIKGATVKNIVIGGYPAVLVFGEDEAVLFWRDDNNSYMLSGEISGDDAMKAAREIIKDPSVRIS